MADRIPLLSMMQAVPGETDPLTGMPIPSPEQFETIKKVISGLGRGVAQMVQTPGAAMQPNPYPQGSEEAAWYDQNRQDAMNQWAPGMAMGMMGGSAVVPAEANSLRMGIKAYHGSPHDFDAFSTDKIGTGEGAQVYGHGLYFAENEGVAKSYRDALAQSTINGKNYNPYDALHVAASQIEESGSRAAAIKEIEQAIARDPGDPSGHFPRVLSLLKSDREIPTITPSGKMYEVDINADPERFLDWDKPLNEQSRQAQDAVRAAHEKRTGFLNVAPYSTGRDISNMLGGKVESAQALREAGIPGIKYLDQGSRAAGSGSRNYVVFDDNLINILRKYGLAGAVPTGAISAGLFDQSGGNPQL